MRKLFLILLFVLFFCAPAFATISVVGSSRCDGSGNNNDVATTSQNLTGANLIIGALTNYLPTSTNSLSDNGGDSIFLRPAIDDGSNVRTTPFYIVNPTSLSAFVISTSTVANSYPTICYIAVTTTSGTNPFDDEADNTFGGTSAASGFVSPSQNNDILVAVWSGISDISSPSISIGYNITSTPVTTSTTALRGMIAYLIQTTATGLNPTWSWTTSTTGNAANLAFKDTSSGGGGGGGGAVKQRKTPNSPRTGTRTIQ